MTVSGGQADRMGEIVRQLRQAAPDMSLYDAVQEAQAVVARETEIVREEARTRTSHVGRGRRTLTSTQIDMLTRHDYAKLALETRLAREHAVDVAGRRSQRG